MDEGKQALDEYLAGWSAVRLMLEQGKSFSGNEKNCAYLNVDGAQFADISAVSGIDFPEDGRALGIVDWDQDGDLDVWLLNRTAPRLRFLLNATNTLDGAHGFVAFDLEGTRSNRDAIGARVEVHLADESAGRLARSLVAGDAFLSQSSKWVHFGLGGETAIDRVTVRWPAGGSETFTGIEAGKRYRLVEGSGRAVEWTPPRRPDDGVALAPSDQVVRKHRTGPVRVDRMPTPRLVAAPLDAAAAEGGEVLVQAEGKPTLMVLWASWCAPCLVELKALVEHEAELRAAGLDVVAITVDGLDTEHDTTAADAAATLEGLGFPFRSGAATPALLEKIARVQEFLFEVPPGFGVPVNYLLDEEGSLVAIYRGQAEVDTLREDLRVLAGGSDEAWRDRAVPFRGRWMNPVAPIDMLAVAQRFQDDGADVEDAERFLRLAIAQRQRLARSSEGMELQRNRVQREIAQAHGQLAALMRSQNRPEDAVAELRAAVQTWPDYAPGHNNLALLLRQLGRDQEAVAHLREALRIQPGLPEAHNNLANALRETGKLSEAVQQYEEALHLNPGYTLARRNLVAALDELGVFYARAGQLTEAIDVAKRALQEARAAELNQLVPLLEQRVESYREGRQDAMQAGGGKEKPKAKGKGKGKKKDG